MTYSWIITVKESPERLKKNLSTRKANFLDAVQSKEKFRRYLRTPGSLNDSKGKWSWINEDLAPTPVERRNWNYWTYFYLYFSWSMDNWTLGSTMIGIGLNWWQSILVIFGAQVIISIFQAINSRSGAIYFVGFPVVSRSVFGMYGAYYVVFARSVLSVVYYAIKLYIGSSFVVNMLQAVFGHAFTDIPNHIPESVGITTQQMLAFILYWLIYIPITMLRPNQMTWIWTMKMMTIPPAYIGLFIFCMVNTKGRLGNGLASAQNVSKSQFSWFIMYAINAGIGNASNTTTNQPDYSRWSTTPWACIWPQLIANPLSITISASFGILATSAINNVWGLELWNQWDLLTEIMNRYWRPDVRFAVFLCATAQALLVLGTNVAGNMIPFGSDSSMLLPRYINITRGQFLGLVLSWAVVPWKILVSAQTFTAFLGGYGLFMAAVVGPTVVDYYLLTNGNMFIAELYNGSRSNPYYHFTKGWNLNAYAAYIAGIALPFAGFIGSLGVNVSTVALNMGHMGWLLSFFVSAFVYYVLCKIFPTAVQRAIKEQGLGWEELSHGPSFVYEDGALEGVTVSEAQVDKGDNVIEARTAEKSSKEIGEDYSVSWRFDMENGRN